ncbi:hypothetical protein TNCV_4470251 [Trichonephila clavipes]|uniref:Uncharacterized protein n=1 Tax=Trichonephila clavipes TaxID=2585209 RepID=A0A8X6SGI8_TRICX|nr:hypothetical protein TNCV_4470251 [Trichonephila clavipes]
MAQTSKGSHLGKLPLWPTDPLYHCRDFRYGPELKKSGCHSPGCGNNETGIAPSSVPRLCHRPIAAGPLSSLQDIPAKTEEINNLVPVSTPPCHDPTTNQDTLIQAGPSTSGHINNLDTGWRNASRSISQ